MGERGHSEGTEESQMEQAGNRCFVRLNMTSPFCQIKFGEFLELLYFCGREILIEIQERHEETIAISLDWSYVCHDSASRYYLKCRQCR